MFAQLRLYRCGVGGRRGPEEGFRDGRTQTYSEEETKKDFHEHGAQLNELLSWVSRIENELASGSVASRPPSPSAVSSSAAVCAQEPLPQAIRAVGGSDKDLQKYAEIHLEMALAVAGADGEKWQDFSSLCRDMERHLHDIYSWDIEGG